ncbi:MAG: hypothetical protein IKE66_12065 [Hyphomicrobium sp.]|nr:hypothetical protein [Hyphomicrobium sp.]
MVLKFAAIQGAAVAVFAAAISTATPGLALTAQECSAKYNAAKAAGTLGDVKWNDFRKAQCGDLASPAGSTTPAAATAGKAVFPKAIDAKYSSLKPGAARRKTCSDQYKANKAANGNGGMKWIMKGGGYYSACNKALKG